ncbi:MAG: hypothetical protein PHW01_04745 [Patescibacteria group bacterium]|nr:hypothetical protein [Patescibacteria group bacterium]
MKKVLSVLLIGLFLSLTIVLMGCAVYPSKCSNDNEIIVTKAMAARALMMQMEQREPVNWHCTPGYQGPVVHPEPKLRLFGQSSAATAATTASASASAAAAASATSTSYIAPTASITQGTGDYIIDISSDGNNLLVAVDARLIRQPGPGERIYFVDSSTAWRPAQGREMTYNPNTKCLEASFPMPPAGDYQGNATIQVLGIELQTADSFWAAVHKSSSKWVKINPSTQKGSINFRIEGDNIEPGPGI